MAWLGRLAVSPPHTHTRAATSRVTKNGIPALRRVTRTWGGGVNIAKCQFSFRILASKYFVKITDSSKRVVSRVRPTIAWAGRAWLMLDLLNKRAARRRLGPAARCPPGLAWGLSSNKYNNWIFSKIRILQANYNLYSAALLQSCLWTTSQLKLPNLCWTDSFRIITCTGSVRVRA